MSSIETLLRETYCQPEWCIFFEVGNGTGNNARRWADAVAFNCFPSRGLEINGFEIKTSRGDWLREMKQPEKAEPVFQYCDKWWLVTTENVVKDGELPIVWGHKEWRDGKLRTVKMAPQLESPKAVTRTFMSACMRAAMKYDDRRLKAAVDKEMVEVRVKREEEIELRLKQRMSARRAVEDRVDEIRKLTGINLLDWTPDAEVATAIRWAIDSDTFAKHSNIRMARNQLANAVAAMDNALKTLEPGNGTVPADQMEAAAGIGAERTA